MNFFLPFEVAILFWKLTTMCWVSFRTMTDLYEMLWIQR